MLGCINHFQLLALQALSCCSSSNAGTDREQCGAVRMRDDVTIE